MKRASSDKSTKVKRRTFFPPAIAKASQTERVRRAEKALLGSAFEYKRVGYDSRPMTFLPGGIVGRGAAGLEVFWKIEERDTELVLAIIAPRGVTCFLTEDADGVWHGRWLSGEKMPVELRPLPHAMSPALRRATSAAPARTPSLFIVSLPRSLSTVMYHISRRALDLRAPSWTSDGEVLNLDRFILWAGPAEDRSRKFTLEERDPGAFRATAEFLDHSIARSGYVYKDVVQPFVVADWIRRNRVAAIRIRRNVADVAYSMLGRRWLYPAQLGSGGDRLEWAMVKGLVRAERALDSVPAQQVDFEEFIANEDAIHRALAEIYGRRRVGEINYLNDRFKSKRAEILKRLDTKMHRRLARLVTAAGKFWDKNGQTA